ncbi:ABC transporter substrate-binding protein [Amycolatopsis jejuensis]|uniref:ABC transporter substrate-binding protein n=1 Tax=Amycolatopsis jejuensis TaxID=330084 RepID=UPI00052417FB|nr:ABC transporter substrate-binding protein [Amycolatopsis jejuensis]
MFHLNASRLRAATATATAGTVAAIVLAGCGAGEAKDAPSANGQTTVTFAYVPSPGIAPIFVGIGQGYFREQGIDLKPVVVGAGQLSPAIMSGQNDLSFDAVPGVIGSVSNGLPVQVVAQTSTNEAGAAGGTGRDLLVRKGSGITKAADLIGKKVGVQRLGAAGDVALQMLARQQSGNPAAKVNVLAVPVTSMETSLRSGDVDAVNVADPDATQMRATGQFESLGDPSQAAFGAAPDKVVTATKMWIKEHPDLLGKLRAAIAKSDAYAQRNPDAVRQVLISEWKTPAEVAAQTHWPAFSDAVDAKATQSIADAMHDLGLIKQPVDATALFPAGKS